MAPIVGIRYKSATREDFDLCEQCEQARWEVKDDVFLKIRHPEQAPRSIMCVVGDGDDNLQQEDADVEAAVQANRDGGVDPQDLWRFGRRWGRCGRRCGPPPRVVRRIMKAMAERANDEGGGYEGPNEWRRGGRRCGGGRGRGGRCRWRGRRQGVCGEEGEETQERAQWPAAPADGRPDAPLSEQEQLEAAIRASLEELPETRDESHGADNDADAATPADGELQRSRNSGEEGEGQLRAHFESHTVLAHGARIGQGERFIKGWRLSNPGPAAWPAGCRLIHVAGNLMEGPADGIEVSGPVAPGESRDLVVHLRAPLSPGRFHSYWRLVSPEGRRFGHRVWADVFVDNSNAAQVLATLRAHADNEAATQNDDCEVQGDHLGRMPSPMAAGEAEIGGVGAADPSALVGEPAVRADNDEADAAAAGAGDVIVTASVPDPSPSAPPALGATEASAQLTSKIALLASMGFTDSEASAAALVASEGDVGKAVNTLLQASGGASL